MLLKKCPKIYFSSDIFLLAVFIIYFSLFSANILMASVVTPTNIDFGPTAVSSTTPQYTITVFNPYGHDISVGQLQLTGGHSHYILSNDNCSSQNIAAHETCTVRVAFTPSTTGPLNAVLEIPSTDHFFATKRVFLYGFGGNSGTAIDDISLDYLDGKAVGGDFTFIGNYSTFPTPSMGSKLYFFVDGVVKAQTRVTFSDSIMGFALSYLLWETPDGRPILKWDQVLPGSGTHNIKIAGVMADDSLKETASVTVSLQSTLIVSALTPGQFFPKTGTNISVNFFSQYSGSTGSTDFKWYRSHIYADGVDDSEFSSNPTASAILGTTRLNSGLVTVVVQAHDQGNDNLSFARRNIVIDRPAEGGVEGTLVRGVNVANGNLHYDTVDMSIGGKGLSFSLSRSYDSFPTGWQSEGRRWLFNVEQKVITSPNGIAKGAREVQVRKEGGEVSQYFKSNDGKWYPLNGGNFDKLVENGNGSFTLYTPGQVVFEYAPPNSDGNCRLQSIRDRTGNSLTLNYSGDTLTTVTDTNGREISFTYTGGNLTKVQDFTGRYVQYGYDGEDNLITFRDLNGNITTYHYNSSGSSPYQRKLLTGITDPRGNRALTIKYNSKNRVESLKNALNHVTSYRYGKIDGEEATVVVMPVVKNSLAFTFDSARSKLIKKIDYFDWQLSRKEKIRKFSNLNITDNKKIAAKTLAGMVENQLGQKDMVDYSNIERGLIGFLLNNEQRKRPVAEQKKIELTWETEDTTGSEQTNLSQISSIKNLGDNTTTFAYDPFGNPTLIRDPLGHEIITSYLPDNPFLVQSNTDPNGNTTTYSYDGNGNLKTVTDARGFSESSSYDALGRLVSSTDRRGNTTSYQYDPLGNLTKIVDAKGNETIMVYDVNNNLTSITDRRGNTIINSYDEINRLVSTTATVGGTTYTTTFTYDAMGRLIASTNANSHTSTSEFDPRGRISARINSSGNQTSYQYDAIGNLTQITDPMGHKTTMIYDDLNRMIERKDHLGHTVRYEYDINGRKSKMIDANGNATSYGYDAAGRMTTVTDAEGNVTRAGYDSNGNLTSVTDPNGNITTYTYDELNRLVSMEDPENNVWQYSYYRNGLLDRSIKPDGTGIKREYDELNRLTTVTYRDAQNTIISTVTYSYDANGNRTKMVDASGTTTFTYDELNRLTSVTDSFGQTVTYEYDGVGNITRLIYPGNKAVDYTYDTGDRMHTVTDWLGGVTTYSYNPAGQVKQIDHANSTVTRIGYDNAGRLQSYRNLKSDGTVISSHVYTRDNHGNPIAAETELPLLPQLFSTSSTFTYDKANRILTKDQVEFVHDAPGRMVREIMNGEETTYTFNHLDLITQISSSYGTETMKYNGHGDRIARVVDGIETRYVLDSNRGLTKVLAETDSANTPAYYYIYGHGLLEQIGADNSVRTYHFDPTGHTLALTDQSQTSTDLYAYTPYGETSSLSTRHNPFRYVGREGVMDDDNGLLYMRARYYRSNLRRFFSLDKIFGNVSEPQGLNRYVYTEGQPITHTDPSGLDDYETRMELQSEMDKISNYIEYNNKLKAKYLSIATNIGKKYQVGKAFYSKGVRTYGDTFKNKYKERWIAFREKYEKYTIELEARIERIKTNIYDWNKELHRLNEKYLKIASEVDWVDETISAISDISLEQIVDLVSAADDPAGYVRDKETNLLLYVGEQACNKASSEMGNPPCTEMIKDGVKFYLRRPTKTWKEGQHLEVNWDG